MKPQLLTALTVHRKHKTACATVTNVHTGQQILLFEGGETGDLELSEAQKRAVLRRMAADKSGLDGDLFVRVYAPPARLVIIGAVHIAQFLAPMAKLAGFDVTVIDPREAFVRSGSLSGVSAIVAWPDEGLNGINRNRNPHPRPEARRSGPCGRAAFAGVLYRRPGVEEKSRKATGKTGSRRL